LKAATLLPSMILSSILTSDNSDLRLMVATGHFGRRVPLASGFDRRRERFVKAASWKKPVASPAITMKGFYHWQRWTRGLVGARLYHVLESPREFVADFLRC